MADPVVLWVTPVSSVGGVARHVLDVVRSGLPGWRMVVMCPPGPLAQALEDMDVIVEVAEFGPDYGVKSSLQTLSLVIKKHKPRVVHTHLAYADIVSALIKVSHTARIVSTEHGIAPFDETYHGSKVNSLVMGKVHQARARAFDGLIAVCESTRDVMRAKWRINKRIDVVFNGVDRRGAELIKSPGLRVGSISRLAPEKRIDLLIDAFACLSADCPSAVLDIAGNGPLEEVLKQQASRSGVGDKIQFLGYQDVAQVMSNHDVIVQLSTWENCSYTLLDAVVHGLGVVATTVGGNPEILPRQSLVDAPNPRILAEKIQRQGLNMQERPELATGWPSVAKMCDGIVDVYGSLA